MSQPGAAEPRALLSAIGLDPDRPLAALDALEPSWGSAVAVEAAVAMLIGSSREKSAGARLAALEPHTRDKHVKREIRRALYRLSQRGLWSPPVAPPPPRATELLGTPTDEPEAWLGPIDPLGNRIVWLSRRLRDGVASLSVVINDLSGLRELHAGQTTRKALARAKSELRSRHGVSLIEAPWQHADALVARAFDRTRDRTTVSDYPRARALVVPAPPIDPAPPPIDALVERARLAHDDAALQTALDASQRALGEPELAGWVLPLDWMKAWIDEIESAQSSVVVVSPFQQEERLRGLLSQAIDELLAGEDRRLVYAERLEESAYLIARRGNLEVARSLVAAALAARSGRRIGEIPILAELTRQSLAMALSLKAERAREEAGSSLVVTPAQALAEQRARARRGY